MDPSEQEAKPMEAKTWKRRICATWGPFCCRLRVRLFVCSVATPHKRTSVCYKFRPEAQGLS